MGYSRHIEEQLRTLNAALGHRPTVAPLVVEDFLAWTDEEGYDPAGADVRSTYAAELNRAGRAIPWPPEIATLVTVLPRGESA